MTRVVVVMGVCGSGKSTVGSALAAACNGVFVDGDAYHSVENVERMRAGISLTDENRQAWLESLCFVITQHTQSRDQPIFLACSALKKSYRDLLRTAAARVDFLFLKGDSDLLRVRMRGREGHFMGVVLLKSQLATLEPPVNAVTVEITESIQAIVAQSRKKLRL